MKLKEFIINLKEEVVKENERRKSLVEFERFFIFLEDMLGNQDTLFVQIQATLLLKATDVYVSKRQSANFNSKDLVEGSLSLYINVIKEQIELSDKPEMFAGLSLALGDYKIGYSTR